MAKKKVPQDEMLIDIQPENIKKIAKAARAYRRVVNERVDLTAKEVEAKQKLLALVKESHPTRLEDGSTKFTADGLTITVKPRDELIQVKESEAEKA